MLYQTLASGLKGDYADDLLSAVAYLLAILGMTRKEGTYGRRDGLSMVYTAIDSAGKEQKVHVFYSRTGDLVKETTHDGKTYKFKSKAGDYAVAIVSVSKSGVKVVKAATLRHGVIKEAQIITLEGKDSRGNKTFADKLAINESAKQYKDKAMKTLTL